MTKDELRKHLRITRREEATALPENMRTLVFMRPPAPLLELVPEGAVIGLYRANPYEAPAASYARFFFEQGYDLALPRFADRGAAMHFAQFSDPFGESDLETGPFGLLQPMADAAALEPRVLFVPLLADHPETTAIGLAWDGQRVDDLPTEAHDIPLAAVVTPTRIYGPFA